MPKIWHPCMAEVGDTRITSLWNSGHCQLTHGSIRESGMYKNPQKIGYQGLGMPIGKCKTEGIYPNICFGRNVLQLSRGWKSADMQEKIPGKSFAAAQICTWDFQAPEASRKFKGIKRKPIYPIFYQNTQPLHSQQASSSPTASLME